MEIAEYYRDAAIRDRMVEFLGGSSLQDATAVFLTGSDGRGDVGESSSVPVTQLDELLRSCCDIERSLLDREHLIVDFDIDYENFDSAVAPYCQPARMFNILEPVVSAALEVLASAGIHPLRLISGKGYHLVWSIGMKSSAIRNLAALGEMPPYPAVCRERALAALCGDPDPSVKRAFNGLGLLLEYVAHRVLDLARPRSEVPVLVTAIEVGPGKYNCREIVSLDISEYGDPLEHRRIRLPFSLYLKPRRLAWCLGEDGVAELLPIFEIPGAGIPIETAISTMRNPAGALALAQRVHTRIPDESAATDQLITAYKECDLAAFHTAFYRSIFCHAGENATRDAGELPHCVRWVLDHPNDWLLKPAVIQHLTRVLLALEWRTQQICELVRSRYEADCAWGDFWTTHDPEQRALFYVRLFAGLIHTGRDSLIDLNCVSHREKGFCTDPWCSSNLLPYQQALLKRRN